MDKYKNFKHPQQSETDGVDYEIQVTHRKDSRVVVIAPHGGKIEPRTVELAEAIAGDSSARVDDDAKTKLRTSQLA